MRIYLTAAAWRLHDACYHVNLLGLVQNLLDYDIETYVEFKE